MRALAAMRAYIPCLVFASVATASGAFARFADLEDRMAEAQVAAASTASSSQTIVASASGTSSPPISTSSAPISYLNPKSKKFAVNGTKLPLIDFDVGESYAGLLPISSNKNETRKLFFWFFPSTNPAASDEITVWLNGGPGCSSLSGLLQENGPFLWQDGTYLPVKNTYSWSGLTNMVWIEQPVGTGFTQGTPDLGIGGDVQLAEEFKGFWKNFVDTFNLHGRKMYLTGESYAGIYIPYIGNGFIQEKDTSYFNLSGIAINDPVIGYLYFQQNIATAPFLTYWKDIFNLNGSDYDRQQEADVQCGYQTYRNKYFTFPAQQAPFPDLDVYFNGYCSIWQNIYFAVRINNPCFNTYHITDTCPFLYSPLGSGSSGYEPPGAVVYFNRADVKRHIHAPANTTWVTCSTGVYGRSGDLSVTPAQSNVLQNVIEHTNNVIIGSGGRDFQLPTNGTLFAIQNATWNGVQGLSAYPANPFFLPKPTSPETNQGALSGYGYQGVWREERGLTFYIVNNAGHQIPGYALGAGYRALQLLLGRIDSFDDTTPLLG